MVGRKKAAGSERKEGGEWTVEGPNEGKTTLAAEEKLESTKLVVLAAWLGAARRGKERSVTTARRARSRFIR